MRDTPFFWELLERIETRDRLRRPARRLMGTAHHTAGRRRLARHRLARTDNHLATAAAGCPSRAKAGT